MPINAHTFVSATKSRACPDGFNTKIFDVYQYNINITVLDPRLKLQWANHAEICAYKTTFAQKNWRNSKLPHTSLHHIQKMTFFSDIFKEQSHGTLEQEINDYLLEQCQLQQMDPLQY